MIKNSPCYVGLNKNEPKLLAKLNEIIAKAKARGELEQALGEVAEEPAAARLLTSAQWSVGAMVYSCNSGELLPYWHVLLQGLIFTIVLTLVSTVAGIAVGTAGASARTFGPKWLGRVVVVYVELIRNTPFIVQLFFIFFGLPALGLKLSETTAAFLAMTINLGAYSTEIIRAGIEAVPKGHLEAGVSLAMSKWEVLRHIVLKQAFRKIYPALSSQIIIVMLGSAVVSQISAQDLTYAANFVASRNFRNFEVYLLVAVVYLLLAIADARAAARPRPRPVQGEVSACCSSASGTFCRTC